MTDWIALTDRAGHADSVMVDVEEYGDEEWIARSRGNDDDAISRGWARLEDNGLATDAALNDMGRQFRIDLERRTNELTAPAWQTLGEPTTGALCDAIHAHHNALLDRINATTGPRWMPAARQRATSGLERS